MAKTRILTLHLNKNHIYMVLFYIAVIVAAILLSMPANAQSTYIDSVAVPKLTPELDRRAEIVKDTRVLFFGQNKDSVSRDSVELMISRYYFDQYRNSLDPELPYFMFMGKNADVAMGIGGQVMVKGLYDWNGSIPYPGFNVYSIPIPKNPASRNRLYGNAAGTGFHVVVMGKSSKIGHYMVYVEAGFSGYDYIDFKLKKAYFQINDFTVGYTKSTFSDPAAQPEGIDGTGPNGLVSKTNVLARYSHDFKKNWTVAGSLEMPNSQVDADGVNTQSVKDFAPDIAAMVQYQWLGGANHVRLAGLMRFLPYRDLRVDKNNTVIGWGVQLSSIFNVIPNLSFTVLGSVGQGYGSYNADLSYDNYDLIADSDSPGKMYAPTSVSAIAGVKYYFLKNLYADVSLGTLRFLPRNNPANAEYKYGQYLATNLFWNITPRIRVGVEYLAGKRMNFDGTHGNSNRLMAMAMVQF